METTTPEATTIFSCESKNSDGAKSKSWKDSIKENWLTDDLLKLSKNQQKKLLKKKLWEEKRMEKRQAERQRKKDRRIEMKKAGIPLPKKIRTQDMAKIQYSDFKIVLDLDFFDLMSTSDLRMVLKQVRQCYSENRKVKEPFQLFVTSFCDRFKALFSTLQPGYVNWKMPMDSLNFKALFDKENIVYLTADSENVLETLDKHKVYVIGGLVDHNKHKSLCFERAKQCGIAHAQLPIGKYCKLSSRKVLTINHVFEILLQFKEGQDWKEAFLKVIPKRKGLDNIEEAKSVERNTKEDRNVQRCIEETKKVECNTEERKDIQDGEENANTAM